MNSGHAQFLEHAHSPFAFLGQSLSKQTLGLHRRSECTWITDFQNQVWPLGPVRVCVLGSSWFFTVRVNVHESRTSRIRSGHSVLSEFRVCVLGGSWFCTVRVNVHESRTSRIRSGHSVLSEFVLGADQKKSGLCLGTRLIDRLLKLVYPLDLGSRYAIWNAIHIFYIWWRWYLLPDDYLNSHHRSAWQCIWHCEEKLDL